MENSGEYKKRNLDESPRDLDVSSSKKSRPSSSPPQGHSSSTSIATDTATATATDSCRNTVADMSSLQDYNVKQNKTEEFESTEKQADEGDEKDRVLESVDPQNEYPKEEREHLFDGEDKNSYRTFCRQISCPLPTLTFEDPSSPFAGEDDGVDQKFNMFLSEFPGEEDDNAYLRLRQDANEITVALSMEEIRELDDSKPFLATAQHIDAYLHCRLRLFPDEIQQRINRCSAYMISLNLRDLKEWKDRTPLSILEKAIDIEMKEVDFNIIPLLYGKQWTLVIVCGLGQPRDAHLPGVPFSLPCVLHFNPLVTIGFKKCHAYSIAKAVAKKAHIEPNPVKWYEIQCPQQLNRSDCGFYIMRFAVDFVKNISSPHPLPVTSLFYLLQFSLRYTESEEQGEVEKVARKARQQLTESEEQGEVKKAARKARQQLTESEEQGEGKKAARKARQQLTESEEQGEVKKAARKARQQLKGFIGSIQPEDTESEEQGEVKKVARKARQQLKGFIGSIQPEERDWTDEFSEGRPCTIDILPYCIPEKIIKVDGNEYKVKMLNWVRTPSVPSDYVMKHWKHIYDDYISSSSKSKSKGREDLIVIN